MSVFSLTGKTAIVTGSGYGLGKSIALGLSSAGANVVVSGRTEEAINETAALIRGKGGQSLAHRFDALDSGQCNNLVAVAAEEYGQLDIMVVNHGTIEVAAAEDTGDGDWQRCIDANLSSCFYCARSAGRQMINQGSGGSIILTSSTASTVAFANLVAYGASKGGVDQLCRQLALEWGQYGIRVNTINPGYTTHRMGSRPSEDYTADWEEEIQRMTPLGRRGEPEEFVGPVVFLASDAASFVTGVSLPVDGGYCAY